jgi:hypothetical protein
MYDSFCFCAFIALILRRTQKAIECYFVKLQKNQVSHHFVYRNGTWKIGKTYSKRQFEGDLSTEKRILKTIIGLNKRLA